MKHIDILYELQIFTHPIIISEYIQILNTFKASFFKGFKHISKTFQ